MLKKLFMAGSVWDPEKASLNALYRFNGKIEAESLPRKVKNQHSSSSRGWATGTFTKGKLISLNERNFFFVGKDITGKNCFFKILKN